MVTMNVYLVPAARGTHELYCEIASPPPAADAPASTLWSRLVARFHHMVEEGEAQRQGQGADGVDRGRLWRAITRRVAEAVAEQRLLWHLRQETAATLVYPDDLTEAQAVALSRGQLAADYAKHRRWGLIDAVLMAITGPVFFLVPGPNVISWYFAFRAVGHFFSFRGAKKGLSSVAWTCSPSPALTELRAVLTLDTQSRARRVEQIAATLGLDRLPFFIERIA